MCKKKTKENNTYTALTQYEPFLDKMTDYSLKDYIINRVIDQIDWYDRKSVEKQDKYKKMSIFSIILNGIIPVVVLFSECGIYAKVFIALFSSAAGVINSVIVLCNYKELWVQYRSNCETLKSILYQFFLSSGEFESLSLDSKEVKVTLVTRCETLMIKEFQTWVSSTHKDNNNSSNQS